MLVLVLKVLHNCGITPCSRCGLGEMLIGEGLKHLQWAYHLLNYKNQCDPSQHKHESYVNFVIACQWSYNEVTLFYQLACTLDPYNVCLNILPTDNLSDDLGGS